MENAFIQMIYTRHQHFARQAFLYLILYCCLMQQLSRTFSIPRYRGSDVTRRIDSSRCKLTQLGSEYRGFGVTTTVGGIRCQYWETEQPLHAVRSDIKDQDFSDRSKKAAKNYCRNPTRDPRGPWCYTLDPSVIDDECPVPLCNYGECRVTGPGAEYGGTRKYSLSGRKCKSWEKRRKLANEAKTTLKYPNKRFPEGSRNKAGSFCRNPDDDGGGPWCYVEEEDYVSVAKEYCDVPFCDDKDCLMYTRNASTYSTITGMNVTYGNVSFWLKLWNPDDERNGEARILLSLLPIPTTGEKIAEQWRAGVEFRISNGATGQTHPSNDDREFEDTAEILLGSKWTGLWITWGGGFVSIGLHGTSKPFITDEYKKKGTISSLYPESFLYYGIMGTGILWSVEFCQEHCEVHTTFGLEFLRLWPMQRSNDTYDIDFYVRSTTNVAVQLYQTPGAPYPRVTITIDESNGFTSLTYRENERSKERYLKRVPSKEFLDFWTWKKFLISVFGPHLRLFVRRTYNDEEVLYVNHPLLKTLRWFGVGSERTVAHWTFFCPPGEMDAVEDPWPPNCLSHPTDYAYKGSQWIAVAGLPCVPWSSEEVPQNEKQTGRFVDGSALKALNNCRNPSRDPNGPYCYATSLREDITSTSTSKQYCPIRSCRSLECRTAGTANDYVGSLTVTRSGRTCARWFTDYDFDNGEKVEEAEDEKEREEKVEEGEEEEAEEKSMSTTRSHSSDKIELISKAKYNQQEVNPIYLNDTLYPERSVKNASNYCRDPSRNIAGTWCYTTDPLVPQDLCNVRDCEKPEECTFLVRGHDDDRRLYVLPEYRSEGLRFSLKSWEPDRPDTITFAFTADDGLRSFYLLKIGAFDNEKVLLYYRSENEGMTLVKKKTLPHLLYSGRWSNFVIRVPRGRVLLYYEGASEPLFEWEHPEPAKAFQPVYYRYNSEKGHTIGVAFDCTSRCHIENTRSDRHTRILPVSVWSTRQVSKPDRLTLLVRAKGVLLLPLLLLPATPGFYLLALGTMDRWIYFLRDEGSKSKIYHKQKSPKSIFTRNTWTNLTVKWTENVIDVLCNGTDVFRYEHETPLLFYFFSLAVETGGWATWAANCLPSDIEGPPVDGGWSEWGAWACSASCDGGTGTRKRFCDSPAPNVKGEPCIGPDTMTGRCNTNHCGDVTDDTITSIRRRIARNHTALTVKEGLMVSISSDPDLLRSVLLESPDSKIHWTHNGAFCREEKGRLRIKNEDLIISKAVPADSGVYAIILRRVDGTSTILKVVSLAVFPIAESFTVRETQPMLLTCHTVTLARIYSDLRVVWTIGNRIWKDYGTTLPIAANFDRVPAINRSHAGIWKCVVEQRDLSFSWTTNVIFVKVLGPPNWRTHLMEDELTRHIFGWMPSEEFVAVAALILFLALIVCAILSTALFFLRFRRTKKPSKDSSVSAKKDPDLTVKWIKKDEGGNEDDDKFMRTVEAELN